MSVNTKVNGQLVKSAGLYSVTKPIGMADIYSTEEKEIGLWIDNKPLYQKTFDLGDIAQSSNAQVDITSLNIESVATILGTGKDASGNIIPIPFAHTVNTTSNVFCRYNSNGNLGVYTGSQSISNDTVVTIQYTKTTDTPWSGKFVPQGYGYVSSGDIYSFEERQIGVWADGKPLYQKSIKLDDVTVPQSSRVLIGLGTYISNIDNIIGGEVIVIDGSINAVLPSFQIATMSQYGLTYTINKADGIVISRGSDSGAVTRDFIATVRYTKTTDVAGSGEYVPSGDKAVHYSTDEEVIGTWIDGSTLYERTVRVPANTTGQNIITLWNDTNIQVRDYSGCFVFRASGNIATLSCRPTDASYKLVVYTIGCLEQYGVYAEVDLGTQRGNAVDLMLTLKYIKVTS